jgi:hypothetical protein
MTSSGFLAASEQRRLRRQSAAATCPRVVDASIHIIAIRMNELLLSGIIRTER